VVLAVAVPLLLPLPVCEPGTGLDVVLVVAIPLLLPLLVRQPGTGLRLLLAVAGPLLFPARVGQPAKLMHFTCVYTRIFIFIESFANYITISNVTNSYYMTKVQRTTPQWL